MEECNIAQEIWILFSVQGSALKLDSRPVRRKVCACEVMIHGCRIIASNVMLQLQQCSRGGKTKNNCQWLLFFFARVSSDNDICPWRSTLARWSTICVDQRRKGFYTGWTPTWRRVTSKYWTFEKWEVALRAPMILPLLHFSVASPIHRGVYLPTSCGLWVLCRSHRTRITIYSISWFYTSKQSRSLIRKWLLYKHTSCRI